MVDIWRFAVYCKSVAIRYTLEVHMVMKKVTVNLPEEQVAFLQQIAEAEHISFTDALRRSINSEKFFVVQEKANRKVLVEEAGQRLREVIRK
jgi:hypothetical protein